MDRRRRIGRHTGHGDAHFSAAAACRRGLIDSLAATAKSSLVQAIVYFLRAQRYDSLASRVSAPVVPAHSEGFTMHVVRRLIMIALMAVSGISLTVEATSFSIDQSDLWWNPNEAGWGIQFVQRGSTMFATMFVYAQSTAPTWYSATLTSTGGLVWSGDLYATTGTGYATAPFNPASVVLTKVGTMSWSASAVNSGTLTYTVGGVQIVKSLQRQLIALDDFSGIFGGASHRTVTGCTNPLSNGTVELAGSIQVTQSGAAVTINDGFCSYAGTVSQQGQFGQMTGTYACLSGEFGTTTISELSVNRSALSGRLIAQSSNTGCTTNAWFGAARHAD